MPCRFFTVTRWRENLSSGEKRAVRYIRTGFQNSIIRVDWFTWMSGHGEPTRFGLFLLQFKLKDKGKKVAIYFESVDSVSVLVKKVHEMHLG
jgi:hypothetical protein